MIIIIIIIIVGIVHKAIQRIIFSMDEDIVYAKYINIYMCVLTVIRWHKTARWRTRTHSLFQMMVRIFHLFIQNKYILKDISMLFFVSKLT